MSPALLFAFFAAFAGGFLLRSIFALARAEGLDGEKRVLAGGVEIIQLGRSGAAAHAALTLCFVGFAGCMVIVASFLIGALS